MAGILESLNCLNKCLSKRENVSIAVGCVCNIMNYFEEELSNSEINAALAALFNERNGILSLIKKAIPLKMYKSAVVEAFCLFKYLLFHYQVHVSPFVLSLKDVCMTCISRSDTSIMEKEKAYSCLHELLSSRSWSQDLNMNKIIEDLFKEIHFQPSPKVLQKLCHILGTVSRFYPENMAKHAEKLVRLYFHELDKQRQRREVSSAVISGCLDGLADYMYTFSQPIEDDKECRQKVYSYIKLYSRFQSDRKVVQRAALKVLHLHGILLRQHLFEDYLWWHEELINVWLPAINPEDKVCGRNSLLAFYEVISVSLQETDDDKHARSVLKYFIDYFKEKLMSVNQEEKADIIQGLGKFSQSCLKFMPRENLQSLLNLLIQQAQQLCMDLPLDQLTEVTQKRLQNLPYYVECIANLIIHLKCSETEVSSLQHVTVVLIHMYGVTPSKFQPPIVNALLSLMYSLAMMQGLLFKNFINVVVYQSLIRSCSSSEHEQYVSLWCEVTDSHQSKNTEVPLGIKQEVVNKIYDTLISTAIQVLEKLDLKVFHKTDYLLNPHNDPNLGLEARNSHDFIIFINLVEFCISWLPKTDYLLFRKWIERFAICMIKELDKNPLVSGFYKLLAICFQICERVLYFQDLATRNFDKSLSLHQMICKCLQQLSPKIQNFKGDLQIACIHVFLETPIIFISEILPHAVEIFHVVFKVGRTYVKLASEALVTLEKWKLALPPDTLYPVLEAVVPELEPFLRNRSADIGIDKELEFLQAGRCWRKRYSLTRKKLVEVPESDLLKLQRQILCFLGPLDFNITLSLLNPHPDASLSWTRTKKLKLKLPFKNLNIFIYLDSLLPHVVDLTVNCSDRQTRLAACELLHGITMFVLGTSKQVANVDYSEMSDIRENIFLPLLQLGCDSDEVVYQLFNPLVYQLAHWYSSPYQLRSKNSEVFVNTLLDGIAHPSDSSLRDISARCLREFVEWSIKQHTSHLLEKSSVNIEMIITRICMLCGHPSASKRLGGALAFNSVYRVLREDDTIINKWFLELLFFMVKNLTLLQASAVMGVVSETEQAVDHVCRVFREKACMFNKFSKQRRKPPEFAGVMLYDAVVWLLIQCQNENRNCRNKCMEMVYALAPFIEGCKSFDSFVDVFVKKESKRKLLEIMEGIANENAFSGTISLAIDKSELEKSPFSVMNWLNLLESSLNCYVWLNRNCSAVQYLLTDDASNIIHSINLFLILNTEEGSSLDNIMQQHETSHWEHNLYLQVKCKIINYVFDFLIVTFTCKDKSIFQLISEKLLNMSLWHFISKCIFSSFAIGFETRDEEAVFELHITLKNMLHHLQKKLDSSPLWCDLCEVLRTGFNDLITTLKQETQTILLGGKCPHNLKAAVFGMVAIQECQLSGVTEEEIDNFRNWLLHICFEAVEHVSQNQHTAVTLEPSAQNFGELLLKFACVSEKQIPLLIKLLLDHTELIIKETGFSIQHGEHFQSTFEQNILMSLLSFPEMTWKTLLGAPIVCNTRTLLLVLQLIQFTLENRKTCRKLSQKLHSSFLEHWPTVKDWAFLGAENTSFVLVILKNISLCAEHQAGCLATKPPGKWVLTLLSNASLESTSIPSFQNKILDLLPYLISSPSFFPDDLKAAFHKFCQVFPEYTSELKYGTLQYDSFVSIFSKLLIIMQITGNLYLFERIIAMTVRDDNHICGKIIQKTLPNFVSQLNSEMQCKAIEVGFNIFMECDQYTPQIRKNCMQIFVVPLIRHSDISTVIQFFTVHMQQVLNLLGKPLEAARTIQTEHNLVSRIGCWWMMEMLFLHVPSETLESKECPITKDLNLEKGLVSDLSGKAYHIRTEVLSSNSMDNSHIKELFRKMQCAAYTVLVVIVCSTKKELKFYTGLLFKEEKVSLWDKIVDCTYNYSFPICWEHIPNQRKLLVSIRQSTQREVQYLPTDTQILVNSTLAEDMTHFDLTTSVHQPPTPGFGLQGLEVSLEDDLINKHECMGILCALVRHMAVKNIYTIPEFENQKPQIPSWMEQMRKSLMDNSKHHNIRSFLAKLIVNNVNIFKQFALYWLYPVMQIVVDGCLGHDINYMIMDVITMLVSWHEIAIPSSNESEKMLASEILKFLISNACSQRRDVLKCNLEIIRTMVEVWKECLTTPHQTLLDLLAGSLKDDISRCETAIHVAGIFLVNGIQPWNDIGKQTFLTSLISFMTSTNKLLCQCSEVLGMCLKHLNPELRENIAEENVDIFTSVKQKIYNMEKNTDKYLSCLHSIHRHYYLILDDFLNNILYHLPKVNGKFKIMCIEMIRARIEVLGDIAFPELESKGLLTLLHHGEVDMQLAILQLINKMLPQTTSDKQILLVNECVNMSSVRNPACRFAVFKTLMWAYELNILSDDGKGVLLKGMVDSDADIQELIFKFWNNEKRLSPIMPNRFLNLIQTMYSPQTEHHFLSYALHLLLDQVTFSSEYNANIFEYPLTPCDFRQLQVLLSPRKKHGSLSPLFSQLPGTTQMTQYSTFPTQFKIKGSQETLRFQPTLDTSKNDQTSTISSSLMFTFGSGAPQSSPKSYSSETNNTNSNEKELSIYFKSRRLHKDIKQVNRMHAFFEAQRTARRQNLQEERVKKREASVSLNRTYRMGDFPDVQIPYSSIFKPLQALSKHNASVARQMMILLFSGIVAELPEDELNTYTSAISEAFYSVMQKTVGTPMLIGSIFEMILSCENHINLTADIVSSVSHESGLLILGSLVLEKNLINYNHLERKNIDSYNIDENDNWLRLAELYQDMEEWDVVHGVFHEKLNSCVAAKSALEAEAEGNWGDARDHYRDAINSDDPSYIKDFYYEAFYQCLANLSDWKQLSQCVNEQVDGDWELLWSDIWNKQHLLPQLLVSKIQLIGTEDSSLFLRNLQFWLQDLAKTEYMEVHFTEELAVLYAFEHNFVKAQVFTNNCYVQFLNDWINMNTLGFKQRATALRDIHRLSELQVYLDFVSANNVQKDTKQLESYWKGNLPKAVSSLLDWDRKLAYRTQFLKYIKEKFPSSSQNLELIEMEMQLSMADAALAQNNFFVANKYVLSSKEKLITLPEKHGLQWNMGQTRCLWLKSVQTTVIPDKLNYMIEACKMLLDHNPCNGEEWNDQLLQLEACELMGMMTKGLWNVLKIHPNAFHSLDEGHRCHFQKWIGTTSAEIGTVLNAIRDSGLIYLHTAVNVALKEMDQNKISTSVVADAYFKIAEYYEIIRENVIGEIDFLVAILRAMKFSSKDAHYLFPRLLQNTNLEAKWIERFITETADIPEWMFLKWIGQILACLDKPIGQVLHQITLRVAETYPQAMTWPFHISREKYNTSCIPQDVLDKLDLLLLQDPLTETFLKAMSCLAQPEIILAHHVDQVLNICKQDDITEEVQNACEDLRKKFLQIKLHGPVQGSCFDVLNPYYPRLQEASTLILAKNNKGLEILKQIRSQLEQKVKEKSARKVSLRKHSPWLSDFQMSPWGDYLELPGQYTGESRPVSQYHIRIAGFLPEVCVISSMRLPIKLTIIGNNAKEYPYLVKYGEDLRQDQRIQQLFNVMNTIFSKDPSCLHREINIITYHVIPLTCLLGIIQWIDDTKTLKNILEINLNEEEKRNYKKAPDAYLEWLKSGSGHSETNVQAMHRIAYRNYSREETIQAYKNRVALIPWDIFRRVFLHISTNQEEFFARRQKFACKYASMCISHWILGIGDRHLGNCLIREHDGSCVGIDFGCAFGCGIQFLPVPELMPFRMTPHIINLMQPFRCTGLLQGTMIYTLRALRNANQTLLATMEVFVHEPSINWIELAKQNKGYQKENNKWLPQEKVLIAKRKLEGVNPVAVGSEELKAGHGSSKYLNDYINVLTGNTSLNIRARTCASNLTPSEQVDCLMDLAVDPYMLGKTWIGWDPWV